VTLQQNVSNEKYLTRSWIYEFKIRPLGWIIISLRFVVTTIIEKLKLKNWFFVIIEKLIFGHGTKILNWLLSRKNQSRTSSNLIWNAAAKNIDCVSIWGKILDCYYIGANLVLARLFVKVPRPGDSKTTFSVFESSCHLLLPVIDKGIEPITRQVLFW